MLNGIRRSAIALSTLAPLATSLAAQVAAQPARASCGAGVTLGVTAYQCSNCSIAYSSDSGRTVYTFGAELVVLKVAPGSQLRVGDVVVAVNGNPITTRAGADQFAYPARGSRSVITVRRDGANIDVDPIVAADQLCPAFGFTFRGATAPAELRLSDSMIQRLSVVFDTLRMGGAGRGGRGAGVSGGGGAGIRGGGGGSGGGVGSARAGVGYISPATAVATDSALQDRYVSCTKQPMTTQPTSTRADSLRNLLELMKCVLRDSTGSFRFTRSLTGLGPVWSVRGGSAGASTGGRVGGVSTMTTPPGVPEAVSSQVDIANFGFALQCTTPCTRTRSRDGTTYWRFDGYPALNIPVKDGLAAKAGLREGDVLISVNGLSPLTEEGALLLSRYAKELTLVLEISRAGKRQKFSLKL